MRFGLEKAGVQQKHFGTTTITLARRDPAISVDRPGFGNSCGGCVAIVTGLTIFALDPWVSRRMEGAH